jgi:hypothetical protein
MARVSGRLITDLHPEGSVRIVFLQHVGGGYERWHTVENFSLAEKEFINSLG